MDYNKDKALRTKEVAERKFTETDYVGAKKFAQKAKDMCPGLDFICTFITIIDIYCSRARMVNGQPDWHGVLGVVESADIAKIIESFCNLVEAVQAGRNNVVGAEGAFQILSEALCMLTGTFWTKCSRCCFFFQYSNVRLNKKLVCRNCGECFLALPLPSGYHPTNQRTMKHFRRSQDTNHDEAQLVLALSPVRKSECSNTKKRMKKDDGESSKKAPKVEGHEARLVPGVGSALPSCVYGKETLKR